MPQYYGVQHRVSMNLNNIYRDSVRVLRSDALRFRLALVCVTRIALTAAAATGGVFYVSIISRRGVHRVTTDRQLDPALS